MMQWGFALDAQPYFSGGKYNSTAGGPARLNLAERGRSAI